MKKILSLLIIAALLLSGCGGSNRNPHQSSTGKPEAVSQLEEMISALGTITADSMDEINAIQDAYEALSYYQQEQVSNYNDLLDALDTYYELSIVGQWCDSNISVSYVFPYNIDAMYEVDLTLNGDMTYTTTVTGEETTGTWEVSNGTLRLGQDSEDQFYFEHKEDGLHLFSYYYGNLCKAEPFHQLLDEAFLVVDMAQVDPADYIRFTSFHHVSMDEWGEPSGWTMDILAMESKIYDQGWYYVSCSDFLVEIAIPAYTSTYTESGSAPSQHYQEEELYTHNWDPFGEVSKGFYFKETNPYYTKVVDITPEQFSISRIKGRVLFVNSKYATIRNDDGSRYLHIDINGSTGTYHFGDWRENINY